MIRLTYETFQRLIAVVENYRTFLSQEIDRLETGRGAGQKADALENLREALESAGKLADEAMDEARNRDGSLVPTCAIHLVPMVKQEGKHGFFFSCHQRNPDGSFCSYRPKDR